MAKSMWTPLSMSVFSVLHHLILNLFGFWFVGQMFEDAAPVICRLTV